MLGLLLIYERILTPTPVLLEGQLNVELTREEIQQGLARAQTLTAPPQTS